MTSMPRSFLVLAMAGTLALPLPLLAAEAATAADEAVPAAGQSLPEPMMERQNAEAPAAGEAPAEGMMHEHGDCRMHHGDGKPMGMMGMMGMGTGDQAGRADGCHMGKPQHAPSAAGCGMGRPDAAGGMDHASMVQRVETLEKRLDMMQMMLQMMLRY